MSRTIEAALANPGALYRRQRRSFETRLANRTWARALIEYIGGLDLAAEDSRLARAA
jgi:hypothetical protein